MQMADVISKNVDRKHAKLPYRKSLCLLSCNEEEVNMLQHNTNDRIQAETSPNIK